jgi:DNA polymerase III delta prime subunit
MHDMSSWRDNVLELGPSNIGRIMTYFTLVYKVSDFCETGDAFINSDYFDHDEALEAAADKKSFF